MVDTLEMDVAEEGSIGGMPALMAWGQAEEDGVALSVGMAVFTTPDEQQVSLVLFAREEASALEADLRAILDSVAAPREAAPADPFAGMPADAAAFAARVRDAIDGDDARAFLAMIPAKLQLGDKKVKKAKVKQALRKWKKRGGIAGYLGLEEGEWQVVSLFEGNYMLFRDGGGTRHTYVSISNDGGRWRVLGTGSFEVLG
jgi:hypothetical protein